MPRLFQAPPYDRIDLDRFLEAVDRFLPETLLGDPNPEVHLSFGVLPPIRVGRRRHQGY